MDNEKILSEVMGGGLRALNRLAESSLVERWGLEERAQRVVYEGAKRVAETAARAAKRLAPRSRGAPRAGAAKFDLSLSEEQQLMRDTLRRFAEASMGPLARRADDGSAPPNELMTALDELGVTAMAVPEELGGTAERMSAVSQMLIAEDLARGDMGLAYAALSSASVVAAVARWGDESQRSSVLPQLLELGAASGSLALVEPQPLFEPFALRTTAKKRSGGYVLQGEKSMVALADRVPWLLVAAHAPKAGPCFFLVSRDAPGVEIEPEPSMGLRSSGLGHVTLEGVRVPAEAILGGEAADQQQRNAAYQNAVDRGRVAWGAMALGTAQAVLDYVIPYCNDRVAFGEPISHRQSVAFMIADMAIEIESMRMLVYRAAGRIDAGLPSGREAYLARTLCAEKAVEIGTNGVQLLGGAGFIKDHPMELWYRHLRAIGVMDGNLLV